MISDQSLDLNNTQSILRHGIKKRMECLLFELKDEKDIVRSDLRKIYS